VRWGWSLSALRARMSRRACGVIRHGDVECSHGSRRIETRWHATTPPQKPRAQRNACGLPHYDGDDVESFRHSHGTQTCVECPAHWTRERLFWLRCSWKAKKRWRRHVADVVERFKVALEADYIVLGGGNAKKVGELPPGTRLGANANAFGGGFRLWEDT
jgi:hypothetical protein